MDERRKSGGVGVIIALVLCMLIAVLYLVGYVALADASFSQGPPGEIMLRFYSNTLIARMYYPAAWVEAKITGKSVCVLDHTFDSKALYTVEP
jgi:hypothetical protein